MSKDNPSIIDLTKLTPQILSSKINLCGFDCGNDDLNDFIENDAYPHQKHHIAQTTCISYKNKMIGYFSLTCDSLPLDKKEKRKLIPYLKRGYPSYPALKIARMAIDKKYQKKGIGSYIIKIIVGNAWSLHRSGIACRFITVDAYIDAIKFYLKNGFIKNLIFSKKEPISMRLDIFNYIN